MSAATDPKAGVSLLKPMKTPADTTLSTGVNLRR